MDERLDDLMRNLDLRIMDVLDAEGILDDYFAQTGENELRRLLYVYVRPNLEYLVQGFEELSVNVKRLCEEMEKEINEIEA